MITVSVLYPNKPGARFDASYYVKEHMPLTIKLMSPSAGFKSVSVERGVGGAVPGAPAPYLAMCHFKFDTAENFMAAFLPHAQTLQQDMVNYTDLEPVIQINEVMIER